jgi:hypothetical protein
LDMDWSGGEVRKVTGKGPPLTTIKIRHPGGIAQMRSDRRGMFAFRP